MEKRLKISFKKRSQTDWLLWCVVLLQFFMPFLIEVLKLPHLLRYSLDVVWALLFVYMILAQRRKKKTGTGALGVLIAVFFAYVTIDYLFQFQSGWYYLWGVRNNFRFFVTFLAVAMFLKSKDVEYYFKVFDIFFWINMAVTLVQFFALGVDGDQLGGVFGTQTGANGYSIIFFVVVLTRSLLFYLDKKEPLRLFLLKSAVALLIAALAEIKFFFIAYILIVGLAILFTNFTWRKFWVVVGSFAAVAGFAALLILVFPESENFLTWDFILEYAGSDKGYTSDGDLNRLNAIRIINEEWLRDGWQQLFGLGLGNCDYANFDFLLTPFFENYGDMHYHWFSYAFLYLETGWIGLIFYFSFFILIYFQTRKLEKKSDGKVKNYCCMSRILTLFCMLLSVHNVALRTEAGYIMFFALAVPFALVRENEKKVCLYDKKMDHKSTI